MGTLSGLRKSTVHPPAIEGSLVPTLLDQSMIIRVPVTLYKDNYDDEVNQTP